ncbi:chemerin-like receptor 1 [Corythoichthys intestinalis]|uniref:chemerin-like receptor 1 n=1 Tax=Corythoichthys intestinalis TaxID=161448 RepID=UPI0025A67612|nr:chemerin-like receptor 1 [Corythoichthys intestinalis]XP_057689710.1 chemerin-like receptor 1 [Corythoichthys intestinalis]XP_057689711.1 chemerin-like receptor 1 [Corythoichthys intestinalis]
MAAITPTSFDINRTAATEEDGPNDLSDYETEIFYTRLNHSLNIMSIVIYSLAFILGVLGNGLVIWVTGFMMKKTVNTVWFLNLAVADFLFTAFLPLSAVYIALKFHWPFGTFMCKLNTAVSTLNMYASVYILMVISIDRCVAVVFPVWAQNHRRVKRASHVSLCVWVVALILSIPPFVFRDTGPSFFSKDVINCFNNYAFSDDFTPELNQLRLFRHQSLALTRFFLSFAIPFSIIVACYAVIIHRIRKNLNLVGRSSRTFKIIAAIIIVFFLCWAPFHILVLMEVTSHRLTSVELQKVVMIGSPIATSLAYINSCLNPFLYVFMGQDFKDKAFKSILRALENAFQEEDSHADSKTVETSQGNANS